LEVKALQELIDHERILGLAEVMDYPGIVYRDPVALEKIRMARSKNIDGHTPRLSGRDLQAYLAARIRSDHECSSLQEAREKLRLGMSAMIREGSAAKNLQDLLYLVTPLSSRQFMFISDDRHPLDILDEEHINFMIKVAVQSGMDPILALQIASLNAARYFGLKDHGAIAPGFKADIIVLDDRKNLWVKKVFKDGRLMAEDGRILVPLPSPIIPKGSAMRMRDLSLERLEIPAVPELDFIGVIGLIPDQIVIKPLLLPAKTSEGRAVADISRNILVMAVIEMHRTTGIMGLGFVQGFGLKSDALATSVAHDSHNIAVVGTSPRDLLCAAQAVICMGGWMAMVKDEKVKASLPLPIAGLLSDKHIREREEGIDHLNYNARQIGCPLRNPFMTLSFHCLSVIPEPKLTDKGMVDVNKFDVVPVAARNLA
jgi:adenine deaminase